MADEVDSLTVKFTSVFESRSISASNQAANLEFQMFIKRLGNVLDKAVMILVEYGFHQNEISFMLNLHPSTVSRIIKRVIRSIDEEQFDSAVEKARLYIIKQLEKDLVEE